MLKLNAPDKTTAENNGKHKSRPATITRNLETKVRVFKK